MKTTKYVGLSLVSLMLLGGASSAHAAGKPVEVLGQVDETPTTVILKDKDDENGPDNFNPLDPNQHNLTLEKVPSRYEFESFLQRESYDLTSKVQDQTIDVFNDRTSRDWHVVAKVDNNQLSVSTDANKTFSVASFKINGVELSTTGASGIVSKAEDKKTSKNNTGTISTPVNEVKIGFSDITKSLKSGDELNGKINYELWNTPEA